MVHARSVHVAYDQGECEMCELDADFRVFDDDAIPNVELMHQVCHDHISWALDDIRQQAN